MHINIQRLVRRLGEVNKFGALNGGGVSRPSLSTADQKARDWLSGHLTALGLGVEVDQIGNMFGIWKGQTNEVIGAGSHLDTVPTGGYYDGTLGVVAALEGVEAAVFGAQAGRGPEDRRLTGDRIEDALGQRARIPEVDERHAAHREPQDGPGPQLDRSRVPQREHHALTGGYT